MPDTAYFTLAPDWVCEVLSASTRRFDLHGKRPIYAREGVGHLWLVDPADRTLEAFELREGQWVLIASAQDDDPVSICPFDTVRGSHLQPRGSLALSGPMDRAGYIQTCSSSASTSGAGAAATRRATSPVTATLPVCGA